MLLQVTHPVPPQVWNKFCCKVLFLLLYQVIPSLVPSHYSSLEPSSVAPIDAPSSIPSLEPIITGQVSSQVVILALFIVLLQWKHSVWFQIGNQVHYLVLCPILLKFQEKEKRSPYRLISLDFDSTLYSPLLPANNRRGGLDVYDAPLTQLRSGVRFPSMYV